MRRKEMVSIIVLNWNGIRLTSECLHSIRKNTVYAPFEVILVDNGSDESNVRELKRLKGKGFIDKLVLNKENRGFSAANNQGFDAAKGKYLFMLNNDTLVTKGWLKNCVSLMEREKRVAAVGCRLVDKPQFESGEYSLRPDRQVKTTCGAAMLVSGKAIGEIGDLDAEHFSPIYGEETDWCYRARNAGYRVMETDRSLVVHLGSHDTKKGRGREAAFELLNTHRLKAMLFNLGISQFLGHVPGLALIFVNAARQGLLIPLLRSYWKNIRNWREIARERKKRKAPLL